MFGKIKANAGAWLIWSVLFTLLLSPHLTTPYLIDNFTVVKWSAVYLASFLGFLALVFSSDLAIPKGKIAWAAGALTVAKILSFAVNVNWVTAISFLDAIIFVLLVLVFLSGFQKKVLTFENIFWLFCLSSLWVGGRSAYDLIRCRIIGMHPDPVCFATSFGNINMISEYLLLSVPFLIYFMRVFKGWKAHVAGILYTTFLVIMLTGWSRSAWLGMSILMIYSFVRGISRRELGYGVVAFGLFAATFTIPTIGMDYMKAKDSSFGKRTELLFGTLTMLQDSPLGVGGAEFEYGYIPYQLATGEKPSEAEIYRTPHNEFMKWGIEGGWLFLLSSIFWWLTLLIFSWTKIKEKEWKIFAVASLLTLGPQMLFQFPFDNAASFFMISLVLAMIIYKIEWQSVSFKWPWKIPLAAMAAICLWNCVAFTYSHYTDSMHATNLEMLTKGCAAYPANWRACNSKGVVQVLSAYPADAFPTVKAELEKRPFQYVALRVLALAQLKTGKQVEGCQGGRIYDSFFGGKSLWSDFLKLNCQNIENPLKYENGAQYKRDYLKWLDSQIK